jgi:hypothetical protein
MVGRHSPPDLFFALARNGECAQGREYCARGSHGTVENGPAAEARNDSVMADPKRPHANGLAATDRRPHIGGRGTSSSS